MKRKDESNIVYEHIPCVLYLGSKDVWLGGGRQQAESTEILLRQWDGSKLKDVSVSGVGDAWIEAMAATSSTDIWAVGTMFPDDSEYGGKLCLHWDGNSWKKVTIPEFGTSATWIYSAATPSQGELWIAGDTINAADDQSWSCIVAQYKNGKWTSALLPAPTPNDGAYLNAMTIDASGTVWAAGSITANSVNIPLVFHLNGGTWQISDISSVAGNNFAISAMKALGSDVWICGRDSQGEGWSAHWNGAQWNIVPTIANLQITAIDGDSTDNLWALSSLGTSITVLKWNSGSWDARAISQPAFIGEIPQSIAVGTKDDIWIAGPKQSGNGTAVAQHWDGTQWNAILNPEGAALKGQGIVADAATTPEA